MVITKVHQIKESRKLRRSLNYILRDDANLKLVTKNDCHSDFPYVLKDVIGKEFKVKELAKAHGHHQGSSD